VSQVINGGPAELDSDGPAARTASLLLSAVEEFPHWVSLARCVETDPEVFFPEKGGSTRAAKAICRGCEVREECLAEALVCDERFGVWGGLSERERRVLKHGQDAAA
jgi:WhiB family redox-sensing transcriptional regulator